MKKIIIITTHKKILVKKLLLKKLPFYLVILVLAATLLSTINYNKLSQVFHRNESGDWHNQLPELEKENSMLKNLLSTLIPEKQKIIVEDEYRNIYMNYGIAPPPLPVSPLTEVIEKGSETKFKILYDEADYLRPVYDPGWKGAYYRCWLYLPYKNIEARHKIFAFSIGGSANYDIFGSLGHKPKSSPDAPIDNHRNINFLIYGFDVDGVRVYQNQVALIGRTRQAGAQVVSIVQDHLLPDGIDTKDFVFQLSTPGGYEIDFLHHNIIRYEYLMKQIKEHSVQTSHVNKNEKDSLEKLLKENQALKQELAFFIPDTNEIIYQYKDISLEILPDIGTWEYGIELPFNFKFNNPMYKRPLYDPLWKTNYRKKWCNIPIQIESNMHRLHIIPQDDKDLYDFFGVLGFHEEYESLKSEQKGFLVFNFSVSKVTLFNNQFFIAGIPSRTGAQIISVKSSYFNNENCLINLITEDGEVLESLKLGAYIFHEENTSRNGCFKK